MCLALLVCLGAVPAMAQSDDRIQFSAPFAFTAGLATLPAGDYLVSKQGDSSGVYLIGSRTGAASAMVIARGGEASGAATKPNVNFMRQDGKYYLASIALANGSVVALLNPPPPEGRAALMVRKVRMAK
jgi:hypothetical protein